MFRDFTISRFFVCGIAENVKEGLQSINYIKNTGTWVVQCIQKRSRYDGRFASLWPSTSSTEGNIATVVEMVTENCHLSLREIVANFLCHESIRTILNTFFWAWNAYGFTSSERPEFSSKTESRKGAEDMLERVNSDPTFIKLIVTGDETWVYEFDMQTSQQASEWRLPTEPKPKKPRQSWSKIKVILTVFFHCRGSIIPLFIIIWALWSVQESKFVKTGQICEKKIRRFCTTITHYLTRLSLWINFWPKTQRIS